MAQPPQQSTNSWLSPTVWRSRLVFWGGALLVGLLATGFAISAEHANDLFTEYVVSQPYLPLIVCPLGLGLVAWLTHRFAPDAKGSGIPQAIAALSIPNHDQRVHLLSFRVALSKILLCLMGMLSGASIGREGPSVHVGAAIMFSLGRFSHFPHHFLDRGLILAGGAAGIAAAFNTPLAGIIFAIEEMGRSFEERTSGTILTAVFLAGISAIAIQGNYTYFGTSTTQLSTTQMWVPILVCGIGGGLLGGLFAQSLVWATQRLSGFAGRRPVLLALSCGLALAVIGMLAGGNTYGTGYAEARQIIAGGSELGGEFSLLKMAATWVSYISGIPGGIFAPSLAAGAGVGAGLADWLPGYPFAAVVILGIVGYFTGVVQTPITAFVIVMEMVDNNGLVLPLMATAFVANISSRLVCPEPIFRVLSAGFLPRQEAPDSIPETNRQDARD